jgi:hypothetical protein
MPTRSSITITYDGNDITDHVIYESATFDMNANATPGSFSFRVKDTGRDQTFEVLNEVTLTIDGKKLFGGYVQTVKRGYAFPVVDTSVIANVEERIWEIAGSDYNILFDRLVINDSSDYTSIITVEEGWDDQVISRIAPYFDVPAGFDWTTRVQRIAELGIDDKSTKFKLPTQGTKFREVMEGLRTRSAATYYIDADMKLVWTAVGDTENSWGITDRGGVTGFIGVRELTASQDGTSMVTDALIWVGNEIYADEDQEQEDGSGLFFYRFPDPPANDLTVEGKKIYTKEDEQKGIDKQNRWGRWQMSEHNFGEGNSMEKGARRGKQIVLGPSGTARGIEGGLGQPLWDVQATWFGHDVPGGDHIPAGYMMNMIFYAMGTSEANPLVLFLPLRHAVVTFPTIPENPTGEETYVQFNGSFGIQYSDHRKLWAMMKKGRKQQKRNLPDVVATETASSRYSDYDAANPDAEPNYYASGKLTATRQTASVYSIGVGYIGGTSDVYVNGLQYSLNVHYTETDVVAGEITFNFDLETTDKVYVEFRAAG